MKYGYARTSTDDQNPALQLTALRKVLRKAFPEAAAKGRGVGVFRARLTDMLSLRF